MTTLIVQHDISNDVFGHHQGIAYDSKREWFLLWNGNHYSLYSKKQLIPQKSKQKSIQTTTLLFLDYVVPLDAYVVIMTSLIETQLYILDAITLQILWEWNGKEIVSSDCKKQ